MTATWKDWMYSVIVPTYNRAQNLGPTLESLLAQVTDLPYEIIVVDNNSSDETGAVARVHEARAHGKLHYIFQREQGLSLARNAGIAAAKGDVIAFVDDDAIASPNWLENVAATYRTHPDAWCVGGKIVLGPQIVLPSWFDPTSKSLLAHLSCLDLGDDIVKLEYPRGVFGANFSVRRDALSRVGLFNPNLGWNGKDHHLAGEESDLCRRIYRAGGSIYYCGQAMVTHVVASRLTKRYFRQHAYSEGRTFVTLFPERLPRGNWRTAARLGFGALKMCAGALYRYSLGDVRGALERELGLWSRLGGLQETLGPRRVTGNRVNHFDRGG